VANRRWRAAVKLILKYLETATDIILQITHKFSKEVEKLQKQKFLTFSNSTTFSNTNFSNSA
jgi:peroxiredoxin